MVRSNPDGFRDENEEYGSRVLDTDAVHAHGGKRRKEDLHTVDA
jgi:hypothetical protein